MPFNLGLSICPGSVRFHRPRWQTGTDLPSRGPGASDSSRAEPGQVWDPPSEPPWCLPSMDNLEQITVSRGSVVLVFRRSPFQPASLYDLTECRRGKCGRGTGFGAGPRVGGKGQDHWSSPSVPFPARSGLSAGNSLQNSWLQATKGGGSLGPVSGRLTELVGGLSLLKEDTGAWASTPAWPGVYCGLCPIVSFKVPGRSGLLAKPKSGPSRLHGRTQDTAQLGCYPGAVSQVRRGLAAGQPPHPKAHVR